MKRTSLRIGPMAERWIVCILLLTFNDTMSLGQDLKTQMFTSVFGVTPASSIRLPPIYTRNLASRLACASDCATNQCCVSVVISVTHENNTRINCSFYDTHFDDKFLTSNAEYIYMHKKRLQGKCNLNRCLRPRCSSV